VACQGFWPFLFYCLSSVSLENVLIDVHDLEKGMDSTKREYEARKHSRDQPVILRDFLVNSEEKLRKLQSDVKTAQVEFT